MSPAQSVTTTAEPSLLSRAWLVVALLFVVGMLNYLDRVMITTMRSSIVDAIPMTDTQFGLLTAVFLWTYGLLSPMAGFLADRFSRSRVIIGSLFVWSAVTLLTAYSNTFGELLVTRLLMGVSEACYIPAALALIVDYHRGSTRSLATGIHIGGMMLGQSLGFVGGWLAQDNTWNSPFRIFGIVGIMYALVLVFFLKEAPSSSRASAVPNTSKDSVHFASAVKSLFSRGGFVLALFFWGFLGMVGWLVIGWLPTYYQEHFRLSQAEAGLYATGYVQITALIGVLLGGALADRWSRTNTRARLLLPAIGLLIAAPSVFLASVTTILPIAIIGFVVYALTRMFSDANMMPILCLVTDERYRATGYGILNLFSCLVGGLGIYAGGMLRDRHIDVSILFQVAAVLMVVCAAILFWIRPRSEVME
ncbi:MFS transporter [Spirosoma spitsbergense]|uniref:MFS transporter n=1 Tax=Spirosoma spitsbergense TaxID=431554 RepID=UPI00036DE4EC|nr:MFS transporter [Spirosoma spitsbergense]